jgi:hypothetical protein
MSKPTTPTPERAADPTPQMTTDTTPEALAIAREVLPTTYSQRTTFNAELQIARALDAFAQARVEAEVKVAVEKERERIITDLRMRAADFGRSGYGDALDTFADALEKQL